MLFRSPWQTVDYSDNDIWDDDDSFVAGSPVDDTDDGFFDLVDDDDTPLVVGDPDDDSGSSGLPGIADLSGGNGAGARFSAPAWGVFFASSAVAAAAVLFVGGDSLC